MSTVHLGAAQEVWERVVQDVTSREAPWFQGQQILLGGSIGGSDGLTAQLGGKQYRLKVCGETLKNRGFYRQIGQMRSGRRRRGSLEMDPKVISHELSAGFIEIRILTNGWLLWGWYWTSGFSKMQECFDYWNLKKDSASPRSCGDEQQNVFSPILHPTDGQYTNWFW
jgi:hypothetical protein